MRKMQRLIVCLDGTWNTQADSTNVLHHFAMTLEGAMSGKPDAETVQTRYYHKGVGTSALDSITGGRVRRWPRRERARRIQLAHGQFPRRAGDEAGPNLHIRV